MFDIILNTTAEVDMFTSSDPWLQLLLPVLVDRELIIPASLFNTTTAAAKPNAVHSKGIHFGGASWVMQAKLTSDSSGLAWVIVIVMKDADFEGDLKQSISNTLLLSAGVCLIAILISALVAWRLTKPLQQFVLVMQRTVRILCMEQGKEQLALFSELCIDRSVIARLPEQDDERVFTASNTTMATKAQHDTPTLLDRCGRSLMEVDLMFHAFGCMLLKLTYYNELESINRSMRRFIRYIFHEVRVPFNALVLGLTQLTQELAPQLQHPSIVADNLQILGEQSEIVTHILNDVLSLQKIEDGALTLDFKVSTMDSMITTTLRTFGSSYQQKGIKLKTHLMSIDTVVRDRLGVPDLGRRVGVMGDVHRLRQVLSNIVSNAIKFSPESSIVQVHTSWTNVSLTPELVEHCSASPALLLTAPSSWVVGRSSLTVTVCDEGPGVPKTEECNLFKSYMQIDAGAVQDGKGTGLGLALSRQLMTLQGGSIGYHRTDRGSDFYFTVPFTLHLLEPSMLSPSDPNALPLSESMTPCPVFSRVENPEVSSMSAYPGQTTLVELRDPTPNPVTSNAPVAVVNPAVAAPSIGSWCTPIPTAGTIPCRGRVLVVEDSVPNRKLLCMLLKRLHCSVESCENGRECLDLIAPNWARHDEAAIVQSPPLFDLVLMDNTMPVLDGVRTTQMLRRLG